MKLQYRLATTNDLPLLAEWNRQLIEDEGHRNPMRGAELTERMRGWISADYRAVLFEQESKVVAYALYREDQDSLYLRHFFVLRDQRRRGIGRRCMELLFKEIWPQNKRLTVDVLSWNHGAVSFYRSLDFTDYCLTLERGPGFNDRREL